jgi:glycosyltransferase involved in cell wall biosynthesis
LSYIRIQSFENLKRILFIAHHRLDRSPGQRYRFEQFFNHLNDHGHYCHLANILDERDDKTLYSKGKYFKKFTIALNAYRQRWLNLRNIKKYDLVVLYREAILTRSTYFERKIAKSGVPIIFDFDDAIWVKDVSAGNRWLSFMKNADKIRKVLPLCTHVTAGNQYLAEFARQYNNNVTVFPSTIDIDKYVPQANNNSVVTIGWVGSHTTVKHFELVINVYRDLKKKYGNSVAFKVIGDPDYRNEELGIIGEPWSNEREVELFNSIDIGVMPLDEDPWTKGKCGMKGLLYMSVGKPAVMSAVGMNTEIIEHGVNGFIPVGEKEWFDVLSLLIEDPELRKDIGARGRQTVIEKYSYQRYKEEYLNLYNRVMNIGNTTSTEMSLREKVVTFRHEN